MSKSQQDRGKKFISWLKRLGVLGFLFFLVKGLVWVAIFVGLGNIVGC